MTPATTCLCSIVNGPGIDDFFDSLKKGREVTFTIMVDGNCVEVRVRIIGIDLEDGSHQSWCLTGYQFPSGKLIRGHYRTDNRTGTFTLPVVRAAA